MKCPKCGASMTETKESYDYYDDATGETKEISYTLRRCSNCPYYEVAGK